MQDKCELSEMNYFLNSQQKDNETRMQVTSQQTGDIDPMLS